MLNASFYCMQFMGMSLRWILSYCSVTGDNVFFHAKNVRFPKNIYLTTI